MDAKQYQQLADDFMKGWQDQLTAVMRDQQVMDSMLSGLQQLFDYATNQGHDQATSATTSAHAAADPNAALHERLCELEFRLRMAEQRVAALEAERPPAAKPAAKPKPKPKPRAKKAAKPAGGSAKPSHQRASAAKAKRPAGKPKTV